MRGEAAEREAPCPVPGHSRSSTKVESEAGFRAGRDGRFIWRVFIERVLCIGTLLGARDVGAVDLHARALSGEDSHFPSIL